MKGWIAGTLLATLVAVAIGAGTIAQEEPPDPTPEPATETTANVEVRVWQAVRDARNIYISARPEDGSWATLGTIPLPLDDGLSGSGRFRYGDITVAVPVGSGEKDVEVRVWQAVRDARNIYISARPEGGSWATLGTIPLPLDDGHSSSGRFRYGDITVEVPVPLPSAPTATPTPTPTPTPWVDPRPADTYTLAQLADMPAPSAPEAPPRPDPVLTLGYLDTSFWRLYGSHYPLINLYLVSDNKRVSVALSHTYQTREYSVVCADSPYLLDIPDRTVVLCQYDGQGPLNSAATRWMRLNETVRYQSDLEHLEWVSVSLDGTDLACIFLETGAWCYDPDTYRAYEAARERALAPPDDPLQRYLREQGDPPLWYDDPPFERIGTSTTGVFRMEPYVRYEYDLTWQGESAAEFHHAPWGTRLQCVPVDRSGRATISTETLLGTVVSTYNTTASGEKYFVRRASLCEFEVWVSDSWEGTVTITFAPEDGQ